MSARGRFDARPSELVAGRVVEYAPWRDGAPLSYADALALLADDAAFRTFLNDLLADAPFDAFRWETAPLTRETLAAPFEFALIDAPELGGRTPDAQAFAEHLDADADVVTFENLGRDALLVVPTPRASPETYVHLATFVRRAPREQQHAVWRAVTAAVDRRLSDRVPLWLNTAGDGVAWLHVRLDTRPKYYRHAPYTRA